MLEQQDYPDLRETMVLRGLPEKRDSMAVVDLTARREKREPITLSPL